LIIVNNSGDNRCQLIKEEELIIKSDDDIFEIYNNLSELITIDKTISKIKNIKDLKEINKIISDFLNNPSIIIDSNFRIITHSDSSLIKDEIWTTNINKGYCSIEFINFVQNLPQVKASNNNEITKVNCYASKISRWTSKISIDDTVLAHLIILEQNNELSTNEKYFMTLVSSILTSIITSNSNGLLIDNTIYESLIVSLLEGKRVDSNYIESTLKANYKLLKDNICIMVINLDNYHYKQQASKYLYQLLEEIIQTSHIFYQNSIVLVYDFDSYPILCNETLVKLDNLLEEQQLKIAISNGFNDLAELRKYYQQAKQLSKLNLANRIAFYCDYPLELLLANLKETEIKNYIHPCFKILADYDQTNNTELLLTLTIFLKNNQNSVASSKELYIHRNTIKYRIDKIIQLTNLNLENPNEVFNLLLAIRLLESY